MRPYLIVKRILDVGLALILLIVLSPIMLIAALMIKSGSQGPVLFKQQRPGKDGKIFTILKFRTMVVETEKDGKRLPDFARMTKVGSVLRKTSIDELPQLINIIKGEMSFIGPRPLLVEYLPLYSPEQRRRHQVRPGISGWAQVNGRNGLSWEEKFKYDVLYVDNLSFLLDLKIVFLTIYNILARKGINNSSGDTMPVFRGSNEKTM
jgi:undecaprenyl phosphate N,N'-diacetylbacillosamine 1-phosphate transferase